MSNSDIEAAAVRFYDDLLGDDSRNTCDIEVSDLADFAEQQVQAERWRVARDLELIDNAYDYDTGFETAIKAYIAKLKGESQ
jgi:hypothetical protein